MQVVSSVIFGWTDPGESRNCTPSGWAGKPELCPFFDGPPLGPDQRSDFGAGLCKVGQSCFRYFKVLDRLEFGGQSPW